MTSPAAALLDHLLAPLAEFLDDPATEDIAINAPYCAWVRHSGIWEGVDAALTLDDLHAIAILAGSLRRQEIGSSNPLLATEIPGGGRLQACVPPAVPEGTCSLSIRKPGARVAPLSEIGRRYTSDGWQRWRAERASRDMGALLAAYDSGNVETFLYEAVRGRLNILLAGPTGAGKTTLARSMLAALEPGERIITIEDTLELSGLPANNVRLLYSKEALGSANTDAEALLEASLRMRPDRVLLQELRDEAAWVYLNEVSTGHPGSVTTIHGRGAAEAFRRVFALAKGSPKGAALEDATLIDLLSAAIDVIVPLSETGGSFGIGPVWFGADRARHGQSAAGLLREA